MNLKKLRKKAGLTQLQLAMQLGCHPQQIYNIESGRCIMPLKHAPKLANVFGISEKKIATMIIKQKIKKLIGKTQKIDFC